MTLGEPKLSPLLRECVRASKMRLLHDNDDDFHYSDFLKFEEWKSFLNCFKASSAASSIQVEVIGCDSTTTAVQRLR